MSKAKRMPSVVVIGAGMTGILACIKLRDAGITDITILEKKDNVGGTWRENTYPGVACDVPAHMYTYSFELNPEWSDYYAGGGEIQQYFERISGKYGVTEKVRFNEAVTAASYDRGRWTVTTSKEAVLEADFIICATGILHHISLPDIKGINDFKGEMFHTAEWNHEIDFSDKKVGVIGTGSTAAQFIPELVKSGGDISVFQRTPQWLINLGSKSFDETDKAKMRKNPNIMRRYRSVAKLGLEHIFTKAVTGHKLQGSLLSWACKRNLRKSIKDPVLREKLTPNYTVGCKRVIINNTFYDAIQKPNAHLITDGIEKITETGIVTKDGKSHDLDVLVLSTGFDPFSFMRPMNLTGKDKLPIDDAWANGIRSYRSMFLPNYPNFFLMLGPYTPIGNFSVIAMSEVQLDYVIKMINQWRDEKFDEADINETAVDRFTETMKQGMKNTTWVGGCRSWYQDADGDPILWPYTWARWIKEMESPELADFSLSSFSKSDSSPEAKATEKA